ncbi:MAG: gliding motility-associated C-terminal domain-containing protein, partial [Chitinophagales bacterium]
YGTRYLFNLNPIYSYQWTTSDTSFRPYGVANPTCNPSITTTYYITATDANNCKDKDSAILKVYYPPALSLFNLKPFLCLGDSMPLEAYTSASARIEWSPNQSITDTTKRQVKIFAQESANYNLRAYSAAHCFTDKPFRINVQKPILPVVQSPSHLCFGSYVNLYASGGLYYYWSPPYNIKDTLVGNPQVYPDTTIRYTVRIANDCFDDTTSVLAIVDTLPKVKILVDTTIYRGTDANLKAVTAAITIEWTPKDDLTNPFGYENRVSPLRTTDYIAQVRDGNFCYGYDTATVTVVGKNILLLPTAFSPNGDNVNDYFGVIKYLNVRKLSSFQVFDRWGGVLFSAKNIDEKWDGTANGKPVPTGTYSWEIEVYNFDNERVSESGIIQIVR